MKIMNHYVVVLLCLLSASSWSLAGVVVIVHPSNLSQLSEAQVRGMFLGKIKTYENGNTVSPLDLKSGIPARHVFIAEFLHKTESNLNSYWSRMLFSSKGRPPQEMDSAQAAVKRVASDVQAIAYVDELAVNDSVRVVLRIE
jgi:ABC-type phosphate transport system substrate-binding protein